MTDDLNNVLADLTLLGIQKNELEIEPDKQDTDSKPTTKYSALSVEDLTTRLEEIKLRMFHLLAVFSVSLSRDCARGLELWRVRFIDVAEALRDKDAEALRKVVEGHEQFLLTKVCPTPKPKIPLGVQEQEHFGFWLSQLPKPRPPKSDGFGDGLGPFLS